MKSTTDLRVLMISLDTVLLGQGNGDVLQRHLDYASQIASLDIIVLGGPKSESKKVSEKLTIHSTGGMGIVKAFKAYSLGSSLCRRGVDLIDTQDPHLTGLIGWLLKRKFQIPLEVHCHGDFIDNSYWRSESWKNYWYEKLQTFIFKRVDGIRVVSPLIADKIAEHRLSAAPVAVINTPVDTERFSQQLAQPDSQYFTIVSNIRLVAAKNIPFTLEIIKALTDKYPTVRYRIIGSGPLRATLEQKVRDLGISSIVTFLGSLTPQQVVHEYAQADMMLLLSTNESFGKVIIEAGLMGVPTVASATLGARTIIEPGTTGLIVPIQDWAKTVESLELLMTNQQLRSQLGHQARAIYYETYNRQKTIEAIIQFWKSIINKT